MSWSFSATGNDRATTLAAFKAKQDADVHCPFPATVYAAAEKLCDAFAHDSVKSITTSGHVEGLSQGSVHVSVSTM